MHSTAVIANTYHDLANKKIKTGTLTPFEQWLPTKVLGMRFHWNAIWSHRLAIEVSCQLVENGDYGTYINALEEYWKQYKKLYSTMPFCSNKSISHYVGQCCLDAVLNKIDEKNILTLDKALQKVTKDGAFVEGGHYSKYVTDCFDRSENIFDSWYGKSDNDVLKNSYKRIKNNVAQVKRWQQLISDTDGVMAIIGDGWYEKVIPINEEGNFTYDDMTITRKGLWLTIQHHRINSFALHQHPHCNEIMIAHGNDWAVRGSGMPSYKHVMAKPFKWRRPRNHFFTESKWDWCWIWRHRRNWALDTPHNRVVNLNENALTIAESGKTTIRWPGERHSVGNRANSLFWTYGKFSFTVEGINIKLLGNDHAYAATTYRNEEEIPVVRISGENLKTRISVNDTERTDS
tara:strand:- start:1030 stop:2238 length:1209 start_codon:yes stop_codon:yes gene_type:complete